jgi:hypothetical protein
MRALCAASGKMRTLFASRIPRLAGDLPVACSAKMYRDVALTRVPAASARGGESGERKPLERKVAHAMCDFDRQDAEPKARR